MIYNTTMMKHSAPEMAVKVLKCTFDFNPDIKCYLGVYGSSCIIYCDTPRELVIPQDSEEQWYLSGDSITNKHRTKSGAYEDIMVLPLSDM